jgi:hypothetical protein
MASDVAAGGARTGDGDAGLDGDLAGARSDSDRDGFAGLRRAGLDLLPPAITGRGPAPAG